MISVKIKKQNRFLYLYIIIALILLGIVLFSYFRRPNVDNAVNSVGNSAGNMVNYGLVCEQGKTTYFLNTAHGTNLLTGIMDIFGIGKWHKSFYINDNTMKIGKIRTPLNDAGYDLSVVGNKMFFIGFDSEDTFIGGGNLFERNISKTLQLNKQLISDIEGQYIIFHNYIYCAQGCGNPVRTYIMKYDLNGNRIGIILSPNENSNGYGFIKLYNNHIYYLSDLAKEGNGMYTGSLYKMCLDGSQQEPVFNGPVLSNYIIDSDILYYNNGSSESKLYEYNLTTHKQTELDIDKTVYNVSDGWIYYADSQNNLFKIKSDGSGEKLLHKSNVHIESINLTKEWVYYCDYDNSSYLYRVKKDGKGFAELKP